METTLPPPRVETSTHLGCFLVDVDLHVQASDSSYISHFSRWWRTTASKTADGVQCGAVSDAIQEVLAGMEQVCGEDDLGGLDGEQAVAFEVRRLESDHGPLALVTFARPAPARGFAKDPLTGLPQRDGLQAQIAAWRQSAAGTSFTVLFVDLNDFKAINDEHGHAIGDAVLRCLAQRWRHGLRACDLVARYGGDEFVIVLKGVSAQLDAKPIVERLMTDAALPIEIGELTLRVSATVGMAVDESGGSDIDTLISAADRAMYGRKRQRPR